MGIRASFDRLHHALSMDSERSRRFLDLALELQDERIEDHRAVLGDFWEVATPCLTEDDVLPGVSFLTVAGGGLVLQALVPLNAHFSWQYTWEIFKNGEQLDLELSPWASRDKIQASVLAKVEDAWCGDRMEATMAVDDLSAIFENYTRVIREFTYILQAKASESSSQLRIESALRSIQVVDYLQDPEVFLASLTWREKRTLASWRKSFGATKEARSSPPSSLVASLPMGALGIFLLALGLASGSPIPLALGLGLVLPDLFFLAVGITRRKLAVLRAREPAGEGAEEILDEDLLADEI